MSRGLLDAIVGALRKASASPEAINALVEAYQAWGRVQRPQGCPRKHADTAAAKRAWNEQQRARTVASTVPKLPRPG
jgi:hypothetical protein